MSLYFAILSLLAFNLNDNPCKEVLNDLDYQFKIEKEISKPEQVHEYTFLDHHHYFVASTDKIKDVKLEYSPKHVDKPDDVMIRVNDNLVIFKPHETGVFQIELGKKKAKCLIVGIVYGDPKM